MKTILIKNALLFVFIEATFGVFYKYYSAECVSWSADCRSYEQLIIGNAAIIYIPVAAVYFVADIFIYKRNSKK